MRQDDGVSGLQLAIDATVPLLVRGGGTADAGGPYSSLWQVEEQDRVVDGAGGPIGQQPVVVVVALDLVDRDRHPAVHLMGVDPWSQPARARRYVGDGQPGRPLDR